MRSKGLGTGCKHLGKQVEQKKEMNLKLIGFHKQHLFQVRHSPEAVLLTTEGYVSAALCRCWETVQESWVLKESCFGLLQVLLQFLREEGKRNLFLLLYMASISIFYCSQHSENFWPEIWDNEIFLFIGICFYPNKGISQVPLFLFTNPFNM